MNRMPSGSVQRSILAIVICAGSFAAHVASAQSPHDWPVHDLARPIPSSVEPARNDRPVPAPADAIVLFDGRDLSHWQSDGGPAKWKVENGVLEIVRGSGSIGTRRGFGDVQLHVEWATPLPAADEGPYPGNSGVYLMDRYEVQILDSYRDRAKIYADGQTAAIYGQYPPIVNASLPPGEWQTFDIVFRRPRFDASGQLVRPARMTVLHNGVLVQDNAELTGPTAHQRRPSYEAHPDRAPVMLQNHDSPVRFRNIWIRELPETPVR